MGTGEKERNSEVIKLKVQLWLHATGEERQPATITALAHELNVSRQYVSKLIAQYTHREVAVLPARGRSAREQIKAALLAKALKGRLGAAKLWMRMDAEDRELGDLGQKQRSKSVSRDEEEVIQAVKPRKTLRPQPTKNHATVPNPPLHSKSYLAETCHAPAHSEENVVATQEESEEQKIRQAAEYGSTYADEARGLRFAVDMLSGGRPRTVSEQAMGKLKIVLQQCRTRRAERREQYLREAEHDDKQRQ